MAITPWPEWLPDQPAIGIPALVTAKNCVPRTANSYGPLGSLVTFTSALTARCQGAAPARDTTGTVALYAGDATKLYAMSGVTWGDVSRLAGGAYATGSTENWRFQQIGARMIATNFADDIQSITVGGANFAQLAAAAPRARHLAQWRNFLVAANTWDASNGNLPNRIWWPAISDPTSWPTVGSSAAQAVQSDAEDLQDGSYIMGLTGAFSSFHGAVFTDRAIYLATYDGPPVIFRFDKIDGARPCWASGSIVNNADFVLYLAEDGWYAFNGVHSSPIGGQKIDKWFFSDLDQSYLHRITACSDPINKLLFVSYPSTSAIGGTPNRLLIYNWQLGRFAYADMTVEMIWRALSLGYTLEGLDAVSSSLDALGLSLDSRQWMGGKTLLSAFYTDHKLGNLTGDYLEALIETTAYAMDQGRRVFVQGVRPIVDGGTPTVSIGQFSSPSATATYSTAKAAQDDGVCPAEVSTRYASIKMTVPAASSWTHASGFEPVMQPDGAL